MARKKFCMLAYSQAYARLILSYKSVLLSDLRLFFVENSIGSHQLSTYNSQRLL